MAAQGVGADRRSLRHFADEREQLPDLLRPHRLAKRSGERRGRRNVREAIHAQQGHFLPLKGRTRSAAQSRAETRR